MQASFQIGCHFFSGAQVVCDIVGCGESCGHVLLLQVFRQLQGCLNISGLTALVTTRQKNHEVVAYLSEIHPIAGAEMNAQLRYATAYGLHITRVTESQSFHTYQNPRTPLQIAQVVDPFGIDMGFAYLQH